MSSTIKRERYDVDQPGATALRDKIVHGAFKTEGQMVAFPLCFPSVSVPIRADESRITVLDVTADGVVYGGTEGYAAHLFVGMFHGVTGMVFDMGVVDGCTTTAAICCGRQRVFAAANGAESSRAIVRDLQPTPFSLIQEWSFDRLPYTYIDLPETIGRIHHSVSTKDRARVVGVAEDAIFTYDFASESFDIVESFDEGTGRLVALDDGSVIGRSVSGAIWRYDTATGTLDRSFATLPESNWECAPVWAKDPVTGLVYTADAASNLYSFAMGGGWQGPLATVPYAPVTSMAATFDGRVFGSAGTDMQRVFCYDPETRAVTDIGVAASTFQQRRYCYEYGDAVTGRDGEIVFAERDDLGHLFLYYPRIKSIRR